MIDEVFEAVFGVDFHIGKTVKDTLLHPVRVAEAELSGNHKTYTPQIKLFITLFGLQVLLMSIFKFFDVIALENIITGEAGLQAVAARLQSLGSSIAEANDSITDWYNYSLWPAAILSSVLYIGLMKAFRPAMRLRNHIKIYLVATNASFLWTLPLLAISAVPLQYTNTVSGLASLAAVFVFIGYLTPLFRRWYAASVRDLIVKITAIGLTVIPAVLIMTLIGFSIISFGMKRETGLSFFHAIFIAAQAEHAAGGPDSS